jgi:glycosyltransferase involved in cell wall biosynthesis
MKKTEILIVSTALELGGIERSLIGLLDAIDYERCNVDLFLYQHKGELLASVNEKVNLLPENKSAAASKASIGWALSHGRFFMALIRLWCKAVCDLRAKLKKTASASMVCANKISARFLPKQKKKYDIAFGFADPFYYLLNRVDASCKIGWVHTDYAADPSTDLKVLKDEYQNLDVIAAVSESCKESFVTLFPDLCEKTIVVENILSKSEIEKNAQAFDAKSEMQSDCVNLLSIGRFCSQKNFDRVPSICASMVKSGVNVKWYLIGFGEDEALVREKIEEAQMQDHVVLLGKKENPYPYIKACDLYVQPSRYEGKCVAVREAQMLAKPVVITDYLTAPSQLENGVDGVIVPLNDEDCAKGILQVIKDQALRERLEENCKMRDYSNANEVKKLYALAQTKQ